MSKGRADVFVGLDVRGTSVRCGERDVSVIEEECAARSSSLMDCGALVARVAGISRVRWVLAAGMVSTVVTYVYACVLASVVTLVLVDAMRWASVLFTGEASMAFFDTEIGLSKFYLVASRVRVVHTYYLVCMMPRAFVYLLFSTGPSVADEAMSLPVWRYSSLRVFVRGISVIYSLFVVWLGQISSSVGLAALLATTTVVAALDYPAYCYTSFSVYGDIGKVVLSLCLLCSHFMGPVPIIVIAVCPRLLLSCLRYRGRSRGSLLQPPVSSLLNRLSRGIGMDLSAASGLLTDSLLKQFGTVGFGQRESAVCNRLAYVGDRAMSLALANRMMREGWTVGDVSTVSQTLLTNSALSEWLDKDLVEVFPQLQDRSEKRKGTCVEMIVGAAYFTGTSLAQLETFVVHQVASAKGVVVTSEGVCVRK